MKIFGISGLGADKRVFEYLTLESELIPIDWIKPMKNEPIEKYSIRLAQKYGLNKEENFVLLGVSFGGLIATEISKIYPPKLSILISSIETKKELNWLFKLVGKMKIIKLLPVRMFNPPRKMAHYLFGASNKELLNSILDDTDLEFAKWAVNELLNWQNEIQLENILKIGGKRDKLLPPKDKETILIEDGGHFMIIDKAAGISKIINTKIKTLL